MSISNWDDLRLFLAVARTGRLLAAGKLLGVDHSTVGRRLSTLEAAVGGRLVDRSPRGVALTPAGELLRDSAERIEADLLSASAAIEEAGETGLAGTVRLATPEALGTYVIAPNVGLLHARHPNIQLELVPESRTVSLSRREADLAIVLNRPPRGRVAARRLVDYKVGLFAAAGYLERRGSVLTRETLSSHPLVWYIDELIDIPELRFLHQLTDISQTVFRSSSSTAQQVAVESGLGLGVLHLFAAQGRETLVRVLPELEVTRSYWLTVHADQQRVPRVRAVVAFLDEVIAANLARF